MKVLGITSRIPWPLTEGARIVMYHAVTGLKGRGHDVHIIAPEEGSEPFETGDLLDYCSLEVVGFNPPSRAIGAALTLFDRRPYTQLRKDLPQFYQRLDRLQKEQQFDAMYVDQTHVAQYGSWMKRKYQLPYLFRSHNVEHEIWKRHIDNAPNRLMKPWLLSQYEKWRRFEISEMGQADICAAITDRDAATIRSLVPGLPVETVPAAVDLERFSFVPTEVREPASLLLLGSMKWAPNREGAVWFAQEILPRVRKSVPEVVVYLVGDGAPLHELPPPGPQFELPGYVDDILPYYHRATVGVIPLKVGGGMRVKMVEMMSAGLPVVSTPVGAEGNLALPGRDYLAGESADEMARQIVLLLQERSEQNRRAINGRRFVEDHYSVQGVGRKYEELLERAIEINRRAGTPVS